MARCLDDEAQFVENVPALIRHHGLRVREFHALYDSVSLSKPTGVTTARR